jgi:hypothetical protein
MTDLPTFPTPAPGQTIRAKWTLDGAANLAEAATRLEEFATYLRSLHEAGWTLTAPFQDDYGTLRSPTGDAGSIEPEDEFDPEDGYDEPEDPTLN